MNCTDLVDVASIPGMAELARAGTIDPDPAALVRARAMLDAAALAADADLPQLPAHRGAARRWALRGLAVAAVVALVPIGRIALDAAQPGLARVAVAADGSLHCSGEGYATPIDPRDADLRLLPSTLPQGWALQTIAARWEASHDPAACRVPALSLLRTDPQRVVTAVASVYGPFADVDATGFLGSRTNVEVADTDGLLLDWDNGKSLRWIWTDHGHTWLMEAQGLTPTEGATLAEAISTDASSATWQPTGDDLDLQVVAQRPGPPPAHHPARLAWYVDLVGPDGQTAHYAVTYQPKHPTPALEDVWLGVRINAQGTEARISHPDAEGDQLTIWRDGLTISAGPGAQFTQADGPVETVPYPNIAAIVDALAPAPADDPRLTTYALNEHTEPHP
jgi:hypothetical protein